MSIQKIEIEHNRPFHCPHCGARVVSLDEVDNEKGPSITPCPHTLFICSDEGFEYRSEIYDSLKEIGGLSNDEIGVEESWDNYTDQLELEGATKFASYVPAPSGFGVYVGFAPNKSE